MRFLALTDPSGHSHQNSLYSLMRTLAADARTSSVHVASRNDARNADFFNNKPQTALYTTAVDTSFAYDPSEALFNQNQYTLSAADVDVVLLRLPRPIPDGFWAHLREWCGHCIIVNDPAGIERTGSKAFLLNFPEICPPMRLVRSVAEVENFAAQFPIVLKPLREYGGKGIAQVREGAVMTDGATLPLHRYLEQIAPQLITEGYLAMQFLERVHEGDKRILVVNGEILAASLRLPAAGGWLCNVAQGGSTHGSDVTPAERRIVATIAPALRAAGIVFYGVDTLMGNHGTRVLSEVNTLSVGGFPQAEAQSGRPVLQQAIDGLYRYLVELGFPPSPPKGGMHRSGGDGKSRS